MCHPQLDHRSAARAFVALTAATVVAVAALLFVPTISHWYTRGTSAENVQNLDGRTKVWKELVAAPRSTFEEWFGIGLTNKGFDGLPIDNSWYAAYQDEGLLGVALCAAVLLSLLLLATTRPRGPSVAVAVFLIVYCAVASWTETGLADASPYILDLTVAAALLASTSEVSTMGVGVARASESP